VCRVTFVTLTTQNKRDKSHECHAWVKLTADADAGTVVSVNIVNVPAGQSFRPEDGLLADSGDRGRGRG
jgi:hypothetical protein